MKRMKRIFVVALLIYCSSIKIFSQIYIRNLSNNEGVPYARILNSNGMLIGVTDINGYIPKLEFRDKSPLTIQHLSYIEKKVRQQDFNQDIFLEEKKIDLNECIVTAKRPDYLRLRTYYRSIQHNDSIVKYYEDGVIDFYIKVKNRKVVERHILAFREFQNETLLSKEKKRVNMVVDKYTYTPYLKNRSLIQDLSKNKYDLDINTGKISKDDIEVAIESIDNFRKIRSVSYDALAERGGEKVTSLFGFKTILSKHLLTENYVLNDDKSYLNLLNSMRYRLLYYKHKKDPYLQRVELNDELYVLSKVYVSKNKMKQELRDSTNIIKIQEVEDYLAIKRASEIIKK